MYNFAFKLMTLEGAPRECPHIINPLVGAGMVSAGASLVGSLFGAKSNSDANKTNLKIAQMNNEYNMEMQRRQNQFTLDQWNANNEYNRPDQQVARLKSAGLNPYAVLGNGGSSVSGNSMSPAQGAAAQPASPVQVNPYDPSNSLTAAGNAIASSMFQKEQVDNLREDTKSKAIDNTTRNAENLARIDDILAGIKDKNTRAELISTQNALARATFNSVVYNAELQNMSLKHQIDYTHHMRLGVELDNKLKDLDVKNYNSRFTSEIAEVWSRVRLNNVSTATQFAQQKKLAQDVIESVARSENIKVTKEQVEQLTPYLVNSAKANSSRAEEESENVRLFGIPNPYFETENNQGIGGRFGIGSRSTGYQNISSAKKFARENEKRSKK